MSGVDFDSFLASILVDSDAHHLQVSMRKDQAKGHTTN